MKRCVIADPHLSFYSNDKLDANNLPERLTKIMGAFRYVANICRENGVKYIDIAGDLNHDKSVVYVDALVMFIDFLKDYSDITFTLLDGNHDLSSLTDSQRGITSLLEGFKNLECINKIKVIDNITFLPYSKHLVQDIMEAKSTDILLSHFGLNEAQLQSGLSIISDVSMTKLAKWKLVILGHYHGPQELSNKKTNLYYVGNMVHLNWNDKNEKKRFLIYDTDSLKVESIPISGFSEFRQFVVDDKEEFLKIFEEAKKLKDDGNYVRIRKNFKEELTEEIPDGLMVIEEKEVDVSKRNISIEMTIEEKLKKYMEIKEIKEEDYNEFLDILKTEDILTK